MNSPPPFPPFPSTLLSRTSFSSNTQLPPFPTRTCTLPPSPVPLSHRITLTTHLSTTHSIPSPTLPTITAPSPSIRVTPLTLLSAILTLLVLSNSHTQ
ncbi:uncharacterized protein MONOS_16703 [Monocercomonoides exilis]|uniref:uncharacterized protein n=1 Tax=Monocercomonoides exilis TaxID=2049356 RepID=UPI003559D8C8|nr:hypothetical protein MONOS_16703 [Monocercomonoides exilis]|eukprot:MONOS_16703.1-p1 / transcript=MONOS_16703.1 / gene=MONOS_16703 / organism=Monocercomonoides_exilis_PA203 / gene_product=unspecified product / transcript_product=unspecified product / location=Mono_scaffold02036:1707-2000(-) / protein_length=98 / sequence_SO=supercontig / SO=protein_coding / is_pseudo=false